MNLIYMGSIVPAAWILQCTIALLIEISGRQWKRFFLFAACWLLLDVAIFIGDRVNILLAFPAFLVSVWIACKGSFWKRTEIGLLFSSTVLAFNILRDNYILDFYAWEESDTGAFVVNRTGCFVFVLLLYCGVKKFAPGKDYKLSESMWKLLILLTSTPLGVIISIVTLYQYASGDYRLRHLEYEVICLIALLSFAGLFWAVIVLAKQQKLEQQMMLAELNRNYYELMEQQHFEICRMKHDMANHLSVLSVLSDGQREDYIRNLTESIADIQPIRYCADATVNAVLAVKESRMALYGIEWEVRSEITMELPFEKTDICALYANALDNAVEACIKLEEKERKIVLKSMAQKGLFCMTVRNPAPKHDDAADGHIIGTPQMSGTFQTSKPDKEHHGFGLRSMKEIVERYHGEMELKEENGMVELFLYMPMSGL